MEFATDSLRNGIRSPYGIAQIDLALRRRFNITDRVKLDVRVEYFNLFNHPMFGGGALSDVGETFAPYSLWGFCSGNTSATCAGNASPFFGKVLPGSTLNRGLGGGGLGGGQSALYAPGGPRSGQLSLKLLF